MTGLSKSGADIPAPRKPPIGRGLLVAALLLLAFELWLHTDSFLYRYRSVFAAGRALDKTLFAERRCPPLLLLGNSRADNGFDPRAVREHLRGGIEREAFNLGVPGADSRVLLGIVGRLDAAGCLRPDKTSHLVLALDESMVQAIDSLGQEVFFAGARQLWADAQYHDALRAVLRLYGYTNNLRQLREPATLLRFVQATLHDVEPVGGGAALHLGYRAGFGGLQDQQSASQQEAGSLAPPDAVNLRQLWRMLDLLEARGVRIAVTFPPLLNRDVLYLSTATVEGAPYRANAAELRRRRIPLPALDAGAPRDAAEFVNAGHLNDRGAQRYSRLLAESLNAVWGADTPPAGRAARRPSAEPS